MRVSTWIVTAVTLAVTLTILVIYLLGPLQGNFNQIFLPAEKFGIPAQLKEHGITTLYKGKDETGWDGQFYYYIANDPLALKDTTQHLDISTYRYQRIGLPLLAKLVSKITGQTWVSPFTYYITSLLIVLLAAGSAATFFRKRNLSPYLALFWALGCGTQVTLLNGLPDAAADGFLIISLISLIEKRLLIYIFTMTFAALAREVYIVFPIFISAAMLVGNIHTQKINVFFKIKNFLSLSKKISIQLTPIAVVAAWQIFIRVKFGAMLSPENTVGLPLVTTFYYLFSGLRGSHPDIGIGRSAYFEGIGILLYLILLTVSAIALFSLLKKTKYIDKKNLYEKQIYIGIALSFLTLIAIYFCFGSLVMKHYTGYFKAANIFLFVLPFVACLTQTKLNRVSFFLLIVITLFFNSLLWERITLQPYQPTSQISYATNEPACLNDYRAQVLPISIQVRSSKGIINRLLTSQAVIINTKITNQSSENFSPFPGKGGINMSYQWVRATNSEVVKEGIRTQLIKTLLPNESIVLPVTVEFPNEPGEYLLKLSLVQEGCGWFYLNNPNSSFSIPYIIR